MAVARESLYKLRARLGGLALAAQHDPLEYTARARQVFRDHFLDEVDPTGELRQKDPEEADRRAEAARKLHYARLAMRSAQARSRRKRVAL